MRELVLAQGTGDEAIEDGNRGSCQYVAKAPCSFRRPRVPLQERIGAAGCDICSPLISGASVEGAVIVFRDITEEKSERLR